MHVAPTIIERAPQPYVGVRRHVTMDRIDQIADRLPELFAWLGAHGIAPADAPLFRYHVIDMEGLLDVEVGVPVAAPVTGDGDVVAGELPAGRYVTVTHVGHPDRLIEVTAALLTWAQARDLRWDRWDTPEGDAWGCRMEVYRTDPTVQPDMDRWETDLVFRLAD